MSQLFIRPAVAAMSGYVPGEQPQDQRYIKLNTNENPYPPSPRVIEAVRAAAGDDLRLYPDPVGNAVRDRAATRYGLKREQILVGNGSDELLSLILRTCVGAGDRVVYPSPTYSLYDTLVAVEEGVTVRVPYPADFTLPSGLGEMGGRVTILCHPNSPSGTPVPLDAIAAVCASSAGVVIVDEAYVDFAEWTAIPLLERYRNLIVLRTFSKSFSLAGMRIGLAFAHESVIGELMKVKDSYNVTRLSIAAAAAALDDYDWMLANVKRIKAVRETLIVGLRAHGFEVLPSQTNFVLAQQHGVSQEPRYLALKSRGVLVRYFKTPELFDALRITVGTDAEIEALLTALA